MTPAVACRCCSHAFFVQKLDIIQGKFNAPIAVLRVMTVDFCNARFITHVNVEAAAVDSCEPSRPRRVAPCRVSVALGFGYVSKSPVALLGMVRRLLRALHSQKRTAGSVCMVCHSDSSGFVDYGARCAGMPAGGIFAMMKADDSDMRYVRKPGHLDWVRRVRLTIGNCHPCQWAWKFIYEGIRSSENRHVLAMPSSVNKTSGRDPGINGQG